MGLLVELQVERLVGLLEALQAAWLEEQLVALLAAWPAELEVEQRAEWQGEMEVERAWSPVGLEAVRDEFPQAAGPYRLEELGAGRDESPLEEAEPGSKERVELGRLEERPEEMLARSAKASSLGRTLVGRASPTWPL